MTAPFLLLTCEHGGKEVPPPYDQLFSGQDALLASHRGWDPGALGVAEELAAPFAAPLFLVGVSRLLIDNNRSLGHRSLFSEFSRSLPPEERQRLIQRHYLPHRQRVAAMIDQEIAQGARIIHLAIHSFTPTLNGVTRRTDIGLLYDSRRKNEKDLCLAWQDSLATARPDLRIHRNAPYRGSSDGLATGLRKEYRPAAYLGLEVEINQKLLTTTAGQTKIADLLRHTLINCVKEPLPQPGTAPGDEIVVIVDEDNRITGHTPRRLMRRHRLPHRASYILVFNRQGQIFVQKRTAGKDIYPGYYDIAAGGVVLSGESYEDSAQRELHEELGISGELEFLFDQYYADQDNAVWGRIFRCRHEGPFSLQECEVESGEFMAPSALVASGRQITPDGLAILAALQKGR